MPRTTTIGLVALLVVATAGTVAAGLGTAGAHAPGSAADRTITVSATGAAQAPPDRAILNVAVRAEGDDPTAVRDNLSTGADRLRGALDELDVGYTTTDYELERTHHDRKHPDVPEYRGYHRFEVTADVGNAGPVIDAAAAAGAEVAGVELTLTDRNRTALRETAIRNAMDDARAQADAVAAAGDLAVTGVATVDATHNDVRPVAHETAGGDGAAPPTTIESGPVGVTYRVQAVYNATAG